MANSVMDTAKDFAGKRWQDFRGFTPGQKAITVAAAIGLIVGGFLLTTWHSSPTYAPLFTNLAPADASAIVDKLNSQGISYQLGAAGTEISVPQSEVYSTRIAMSADGLPSSSQTGYSLLDKEGVTTSQFQQQVDYQRAIEGELANTIQAINGVQAASVHLAIPQQSVFTDTANSKTTASVMLTLGSGTALTSSQVQSIVYLVSSSVPGLSANSVTVDDSNGNVLAAPGNGATGLGGANTQAQATQSYDNQLAANLQAMLDQAVGPGNATVKVNASLNFSTSTKVTNSYLYKKNAPPVSEQYNKETYTGTGTVPGGTAGATTDTTGTTGSGGKGKYTNVTRTVDNSLGTQQVTTKFAPGGLQQLSVAVLLNKSVKGLNVPAITKLIKSGAGITSSRGDTLSVQAVAFNTSANAAATKAAAAATAAATAAASKAKLMSMIKQGVLALLIVGLAIGAWLGSRKRRKAPPEPNDDVLGLDTPDDHLPPARSDAGDYNSAAQRHINVHDIAENRPADMTRVLSGWLNSKEN